MDQNRFSSEVRGCPPSTLEAGHLLCYYRLLGALESYYFELCDEDFDKHKPGQWPELNNRLGKLERQVCDFRSHLDRAHPCGEVLVRNLAVSRRLLWLDEDSEEAVGDYLVEEGSGHDMYNENIWFGEPYFWEDQIGGALNEIATIILGNSAPGSIREIVDSIDFYNQKRIASLDAWLAFLGHYLAQHDVDQLHDAIASSAESASTSLDAFYKRGSLSPMAVYLFADRRNTSCMALGRALMNLESGVAHNEFVNQ